MRVWFLFFFLAKLIVPYSQSNLKITNWTVLDGLAEGNIHEIFKDTYGFLWIATDNGLNKFDGTTFRQYIHQLGTENGFRGSEVLGIVEDSLRRIWIGTEEGLNVYFHHTDTFRYLSTARANQNLSSYSIPLVATDDEIICWEITNNIVAYDTKTLKRRILFSNMSWPAMRYYWLNQNAYDKGSHQLWLPLNKYVLQLNLSNGQIDSLKIAQEAGNCQSLIHIEHELLLGCTNGLFKMNIENKKTDTLWWAEPLIKKQINSLSVSLEMNIWIGTENQGLYCFNKQMRKLSCYTQSRNKINSISSNMVNCLYTDDKNILWAGTGKKALDQIFPFEQAISNIKIYSPNILDPLSILCFAEDNQKNIWIGTEGGGISIFNPKQNSLITNKYRPVSKSGNIHCIKMNKQGSVAWIGTETGLGKIKISDRKIKFISFYDFEESKPILTTRVRHMEFLDDSTWLVATNQGVYSLPFESDIATRLPHLKEDVFFIGKNKNTFTFSLWDYDPVLYKFEKGIWTQGEFPFSDITVGLLLPSKKENRYWIGTDKGLILTDSAFQRIEQFSTKQGLPDNRIWGLQHDANYNLWITTPKGIARYNYTDNLISSYDPADGIQGLEYNPYAYLLASDSTIYLGGKDGYDVIKPRLIHSLNSKPDLYLSALSIQGRYKGSLEEKKLILEHDQNNFTVEAAVVDYYSPKRSKIKFKLAPVESEWQIENAPYTIRYAGLSPGKYTLFTSVNNQQFDISQDINKIQILILPPFWLRGWFITLSVLLATWIILQFYRYRVNQLKKIFLVRTKISQDLHDEIGSTLSGISMYSHLAKEQNKTHQVGEFQKSMDIIHESAADMVNKLNDIVWMTNPTQDSFQQLIAKLEDYLYKMAEGKKILIKINIPKVLPDVQLTMEKRKDIFLFCKEAINNAVKYSQATLLEFRVKVENGWLELEIRDNGRGFDKVMVRPGNGLTNMKKRADELGAEMVLTSRENIGTSISLQYKI